MFQIASSVGLIIFFWTVDLLTKEMEKTPFDIDVLQTTQENQQGNLAQDARIVNSLDDADRIRKSIPERRRIAELKERQLRLIIVALDGEGYSQEQINEVLPQLSQELKQKLAEQGASIAGEDPPEEVPELDLPQETQKEAPKSWREKYQEKYQMDPIRLSEKSLAKALFQVKDYELMKMGSDDAEELDFALKELGKGFSYSKYLLNLFEVILGQFYVPQQEKPIIEHIESNIYLTRFELTIRVVFQKQDLKLIKRYISCQSPVNQVVKSLNEIKRRDFKQHVLDIIEQKCGVPYLKELLLNYKDALAQI